jgi:predicted acyl esterase
MTVTILPAALLAASSSFAPRCPFPLGACDMSTMMGFSTLILCAALGGPAYSSTVTHDPGPYQVKREFESVVMPDGVALIADVYRPETPKRVPAVLLRTPYMRTDSAGTRKVTTGHRTGTPTWSRT